ncbi:hypothetical protein CONLIGDRAFT_649007 [Coniochaeta ligniaria NRRL 30616]|uniref:Uncharacterized protein n=1 Tax=Coniochaeta ligniaria NRRL 30616 TaxID=1408157 RepID=A0A1J7J346_9PEZI|nr:hypothetical protein CONLIGDRAFT_649007 [Coniochaeta ligniaria NRRL 30616]
MTVHRPTHPGRVDLSGNVTLADGRYIAAQKAADGDTSLDAEPMSQIIATAAIHPRSTPLSAHNSGPEPCPDHSALVSSPPRRPPALPQPPSGPSGGPNFPAPGSTRAPPAGPSSRNDIVNLPTPAGPRGYVPSRGGFGARGRRGWDFYDYRIFPGDEPRTSSGMVTEGLNRVVPVPQLAF